MPQYLEPLNIKKLQIEVTSFCNLVCPQCTRTLNGKVNPLLPLSDLKPEDYDKIFQDKIMSQLEEVIFNGNYGDPPASKHLDYAIDKLIEKNIKVKIFTNGSLRSSSWWKNLGQKFSKTKSEVVFSIDGLEDTNPIYRINSDFKKIMNNAEAYIKEGGRARWDFLIFEHNFHQIEQAKSLARQMGFKKFHKKKTARFVGSNYKDKDNKTTIKTFNKKGEFIGLIKRPKNSRRDFEKVISKYGSWENYINSTSIHCKYKNDMKALYIDFEALVWPCCWTAGATYFVDPEDIQKKQLEALRKRYTKNFNSLRHHSLNEILSHEWFNLKLVESWENTMKDENSKLMVCGRTCGTDYEFTSGPGSKNSTMIPLTT